MTIDHQDALLVFLVATVGVTAVGLAVAQYLLNRRK